MGTPRHTHASLFTYISQELGPDLVVPGFQV